MVRNHLPLTVARQVTRERFERVGNTLTDPDPCGVRGIPRQRAAFVPDEVTEVCLHPVTGDFIVTDHGDRVTLTRVRGTTENEIITEQAHVTGRPWDSAGDLSQKYKTNPTFVTRAQWSNFIRALSHRNKANALLFVNLADREDSYVEPNA